MRFNQKLWIEGDSSITIQRLCSRDVVEPLIEENLWLLRSLAGLKASNIFQVANGAADLLAAEAKSHIFSLFRSPPFLRELEEAARTDSSSCLLSEASVIW